jgi:hypothetical protein
MYLKGVVLVVQHLITLPVVCPKHFVLRKSTSVRLYIVVTVVICILLRVYN